MSAQETDVKPEEPSAVETFRRFFALERDVLVLSLAMFAFSLGFQMTSRFLPEYMVALGGYLWEFVSPEVAFTIAAVVGAVDTGYFLLFDEEFGPYR